jgi:hypothetical protein
LERPKVRYRDQALASLDTTEHETC